MEEYRAYGDHDGTQVVALVTDLAAVINEPPESDIVVYITQNQEESPTHVRKGDIFWDRIENIRG